MIARCHQWANAHRSPVEFFGGVNRTADWQAPDVSLGGHGKQFAYFAIIASALALSGCQKPDEIIRYTVAKPPPREAKPASSANIAKENVATPDAGAEAEEGQDQLLGAIIPKGKTTWFFKLTGRSEAVEAQTKHFVQFLGSLKFTDQGPDWALPEGWEEGWEDEPGSEMRFATIRIAAAEGPLEMSVIPLPTGEGSFDAYLLSNVNRWRGQFGLAPIAENQLAEQVHKFELKETIWLVKFEGYIAKSGMGAGPFAGNTARKPGGPARPAAAPARDAEKPFDCEIPEGWTAAPAGPMQLAVYEVRDGDRQVAVSVSSAGGGLTANVNRWRGQVQLAPLEAADLAKEMRTIKVDGQDATYVEAIGPESAPNNTTRARETILGVIVEAQGRQWFFKLKGDADLAAREKPHFEKFVQSIRFRGK